MSLDTRARHAAASIERSVAEFTPTVRASGVVRRLAWRKALNYSAAMATVTALIAVGAWVSSVADEGDVAETIPPRPETTTSTVVEERETPVVPEEVEAPDPAPQPSQPQNPVVVVGGDEEEEPVAAPDTEPPIIEITSPSNGDHFEVKTITFAGVTEPGARVAAGQWEADVDPNGNWSIVLVLSPGANRAGFTATDAAGNEAAARITVHYDPPAPPPEEEPPEEKAPEEDPPKEETPAEIVFTAVATFGSCEFDPPYDIYYGTATPGAMIAVTSEFGGGTTTANAQGDWELQVFFPEAPHGEVFLVTIADDTGHKKHFEFVSWAGGE